MTKFKQAAAQFLGACLLLAAIPTLAQTAVPQIILVQNSGWMLPFYEDPNSKFKSLIVELSSRLTPYGSEQMVASFNQSIATNKSPILLYQGSDQVKIAQAVQSINVAQKPGGKSYADTDFKEAIVGAVTQFSPGKSAILWIVTNNKNSPNNNAETIERNKDFYKFLQETSEIKRIVAFPHALRAQSTSIASYRANGLMFYALAYGDQADAVLQKMLQANVPFGKQAARLKPLDAEALTFVPKGVKNPEVQARLAPDRKTLVMTFAADSKPETAELIGQFRNDFYPHDIQSARVGIDTRGFAAQGKDKIGVSLSTTQISSIPAGALSPEVKVKIQVPAIPSSMDPEVIFGSGYKSRGVIRFELDDQKLALSKDFTKEMAELFPGDPLPDLFVPGESARKSLTTQNLIIEVEYPSWPLLVAAALTFLLAGGLVGGMLMARHEKIYRVSVDGNQKTYGLRPFAEVVLKNPAGERVGVLKRGFGKPSFMLDKGKNSIVRIS
jgi:hypothetical protein